MISGEANENRVETRTPEHEGRELGKAQEEAGEAVKRGR